MKKSQRITWIIILLLVLSFLPFYIIRINNNYKANRKEIKIAYLPTTHSLPLFQTKKLLDRQNRNILVSLIEYKNWSELIGDLNTQKVDGAIVLIQLAMKSKSEGIPLKLGFLGNRNGNVIVVGKDINNASDLENKKFAIPSIQSSHNILLHDFMKKERISKDNISIIELPPSEIPTALEAGEISGYCVAEPFGTKSLLSNYGQILYESQTLWENSICCSLVFNENYINKYPEVIELFLNTYKKSEEQLDLNTSLKISQQYINEDKDVLEQSLKNINFKNLSITKEDYEILVDKMKKYKILNTYPTFEEFIYMPITD